MRQLLLFALLFVSNQAVAQVSAPCIPSPVFATAAVGGECTPPIAFENAAGGSNYIERQRRHCWLTRNGCQDMGVGILVGFAGGIESLAWQSPDWHKNGNECVAFGAGLLLVGILEVKLGLHYEARHPDKFLSFGERPGNKFYYTRQGTPRYCVVGSGERLGVGVNF